jgi:DNA-binding NarL/FixJ family response regulator
MRAHAITDRQVEVVRLIARGFSTDEVAAELGIKARTAKAHADALRWKLGVEKRRQIPEAYMAKTGDDPYPRDPSPRLEAVA